MVTEPVLVRSGAIARNRWRSGIVATQTMSGRQLRKPEIRRIVGEQVGATLPLERSVRGRHQHQLANAHAATRKASSRFSQEAIWFQLALFWSTNLSL